jgi:hypothetical protein
MRAIEPDRARIRVLSEVWAEDTWAFYRYLKESDLSPGEIDAVFNVYEALKEALWHKGPADNLDGFGDEAP